MSEDEDKVCPLLAAAGPGAPWMPSPGCCIRERCAWWGWCVEAEDKLKNKQEMDGYIRERYGT